MIKRLVSVFIFSVFFLSMTGQIIYTDPVIVTPDKPIKIYFNSAVGDASNEMKNFTGDVYAHTGVFIQGQTGWKYVIGDWNVNATQPKLTYLGNYLYRLNIPTDIKTFYSVPESEVITKICIVFRNALRNKQTRPDLFIDVFQAGINATFMLPEKPSLVVEKEDLIPVKVAASMADSISLYINSVYKEGGESASLLTDTIVAGDYGEYWVKTVAWDLPKFAADSFFFYVRKPLVTEELPAGMEDGINYTSPTSATLVLHAPYKEYAFVTGDFTGWIAGEKGYMKRTPDAQRYWIEINGLEAGKEYRFQYLVDTVLYIADPYSEKVLDPWNDPYITSDTYPGLIQYPKDTASGMVSVLQTSQVPYNWQTTGFVPPEKKDLIIYELLIRDFIEAHDFKTLIDTLHYLDNLGINAIELMPVSEFEGNISWGYNPAFLFAPDKYYGPKNDMKAFVDSCHARGIAVIMDIVLNHSGGQSPFVQLYLDHFGSDQTYMKIPNPWFNASSPNNTYKWGADFNHESTWTQKLVDRVNAYWLTEYNIDGFRFDFTKGFTNTVSDGSGYDASRIAILKRMADQIWTVKPDAYVILEHFAPNNEEIELANYGMMLWGNSNYSYTEAGMGYPSDLSYSSWLGRGWSVPNLVSYMESHDEERMMYKNFTYGTATGSYSTKAPVTALKRMQLNALFFLGLPGPKMIWQFGELGYDVSIDFNGRTGDMTDPFRYQLYRFYKLLIEFRKTLPVFSTDDYTFALTTPLKRIQLNDASMKVNILGNFGIIPSSINPYFQQTGKWYEFFSGDSITVTNVNAQFSFEPGEYRLYTTKRIGPNKLILGIEEEQAQKNDKLVTVWPNPSPGEFKIEINNEIPGPVTILIFDITGRVIRQIKTDQSSTPVIWDGRKNDGTEAPEGIYIFQVRAGQRADNVKIIKN
jgi:hypothetical protein